VLRQSIGAYLERYGVHYATKPKLGMPNSDENPN